MASDNNYLVKLVEAAGKKKEAENKFRTEVAKARIQSALRKQERKAAIQETGRMKAGQDMVTNPQRYTPEQAYLRRRFLEQNPLAAMSIPEEGQEMNGIQYPSEEVIKQKDGTFATAPLAPERKTQLLSELVKRMTAAGKKPHPAILNLLQTQMASAGAQFDPSTGQTVPGSKARTTEVGNKQKEIDDVQGRLNFLQRAVAAGVPNDQKEKVRSEIEILNQRMKSLLGYEVPVESGEKKGFWETFFGKGKQNVPQFTPDEEALIQENMKHYGRTREEVVEALSNKGILGGKK